MQCRQKRTRVTLCCSAIQEVGNEYAQRRRANRTRMHRSAVDKLADPRYHSSHHRIMVGLGGAAQSATPGAVLHVPRVCFHCLHHASVRSIPTREASGTHHSPRRTDTLPLLIARCGAAADHAKVQASRTNAPGRPFLPAHSRCLPHCCVPCFIAHQSFSHGTQASPSGYIDLLKWIPPRKSDLPSPTWRGHPTGIAGRSSVSFMERTLSASVSSTAVNLPAHMHRYFPPPTHHQLEHCLPRPLARRVLRPSVPRPNESESATHFTSSLTGFGSSSGHRRCGTSGARGCEARSANCHFVRLLLLCAQ